MVHILCLHVILKASFSLNCVVIFQFVGNNDDVLDIKFLGSDDSHVAVATNSSILRVFNLESWNSHELRGHTDIVMAVDVNKEGSMLVTGSKVDRYLLIFP